MNKYRCVFVAAMLVVVVVAESAIVSADSRQPNVLMIAIDDLNDWIGCMNARKVRKDRGFEVIRPQSIAACVMVNPRFVVGRDPSHGVPATSQACTGMSDR